MKPAHLYAIHIHTYTHHFIIYNTMSSTSSPNNRSPEPQEKPKTNKIFVTNLDVETSTSRLEAELQEKFARFGKLESVVVKKSFNNEYSFAFIEYLDGEDASDAVKELNNTSLFGKRMKVELQDNSRRRKGGSQTCFVCGKAGHYARNCRQNRDRDERRSRSSSHHKKKSKKHRRSSSSESRSKRKDKKKHSSKKIKKSKHKKQRKDSSESS